MYYFNILMYKKIVQLISDVQVIWYFKILMYLRFCTSSWSSPWYIKSSYIKILMYQKQNTSWS